MDRLHRAVDRPQQLAPHRFEIDRVAQAKREGGDDRLGVVARPVETPVDNPLHAQAQRVEQRGGGQGRRGDADGRGERQHVGRQGDDADEHPNQQARQDRVRERAADQPVDLVQPVLEDPDADRNGERGNCQDGDLPYGVIDERRALRAEDRDDRPHDARGRSADQPLQLLPPLAAGTAPRSDLAGDEGKPQQRQRQCGHRKQGDRAGDSVRVRAARVVAERVHPHGLSENRCLRGELTDQEQHRKPDVQLQHAAPASRRHAPVRKQQDRGQAEDERAQARGAKPVDDDPAERQPARVRSVGQDRVELLVGLQKPDQADREQDPANRVARLPSRHDEAYHDEHRNDHREHPVAGDTQVVRQHRQRHESREQARRECYQEQRRPRVRSHNPARIYTDRPFRERYGDTIATWPPPTP